ncbi:MAG TPA: ABC transporter substrate-binding protein [Dongiaceae bacterium]|nr:ABC transporter substrate-binding protein [Dongiaceae bacterium]
MKRRLVLLAAASLTSTRAQSQTGERLRKVGVLIDGSAPHPLPDVLRAGLTGGGWVEGRTIAFDVRYADGQPARAAAQAAELVKGEVDIIVAHFTPAVRAAMAATKTIPIIMAPAGAPVETGLVASLSRPGGNVTGVTNMAAELGGRRLQLLKDMIPSLGRVAVLASSHDAFTRPFLTYLEEAARSGGLQLDPVPVAGPPDFAAAFARMAEVRAGAVIIQGVFNSHRAAIVEIASRQHLPTMWFDRQAVLAGGLISLSANTDDIFQRAAAMANKVLKGAKPSDLPVEQPAIFELVINLKAAKELGLTLPRSVQVQADELIE